MSGSVPYWHVDAFADRAFAGNQAAVMAFEAWPDDALLQAIAAENMFAETAFLVPDATGAADRELRWFAPIGEVRLCGHATLAAGHALLSMMPDRVQVRFATRRAGMLEVRRGHSGGYALALPAIATAPGEFAAAAAALGGAVLACWRSPLGYNVFLYASAAEVRALAPDFAALRALDQDLFIATAPGAGDDGAADSDVVSRVFAPSAGIDEDSVTGSAHAVLAPIWAQRLGRDNFAAVQASARGGRLGCWLDGDRVWLEGQCTTVVEGRFYF